MQIMKFIIGKKQNMTQIFDNKGKVHPATILNILPAVVTQVKNKEKDGYEATQVGYGKKREKNINKAQKGHSKKLGNFEGFKEFKNGKDEYKTGDKIDVSVFAEGDKIKITAISKGKGFQGVVKRHGFHGGRRTHGQKHSEREPGSIGATGPQRVFKGTRMGGRMGSDRITVKGLKIIQIDKENNQIAVNGPVPGRRGTIVEIQNAN